MANKQMCLACLTSPVEREVESETVGYPFKVCGPCAHRLLNLALRPLEWYRLSALHGPFTHLLHDDFYDDLGRADQNRIPIKQASLFPAPKLAEVADNSGALLDYCIASWNLTDEAIAALRRLDRDEILSAIIGLVDSRPIPAVEARCYEIAASALGPSAAEWVRSRWDSGSRPDMLYSFLSAVAACLPHDEAVPKALDVIGRSGIRDLSGPAAALARLRSPIVIAWIEGVVSPPVSTGWGRLAATSGLDWTTATRWLDMGRPISLVAMDAIETTMRLNRQRRPSMPSPTIDGAPSREAMLSRILEYAVRDPVPRVTHAIDRIVADASDL